MSDFKLEFTLQQHTPLIHFQHEQAGATLRATEVKARLDAFLLKQYKRTIQRQWFVGYDTISERDDALAFKVSIRPKSDIVWRDYIEQPGGTYKKNGQFDQKTWDGITTTKTDPYPGFFGNMGRNYENSESIKKFVFYPEGLEVCMTTFQKDLKEFLESHVAEFFATHNFGTRKTKGFGSFYPMDLQRFPLQLADWFSYKIEILFPAISKPGKNATGLDYGQMFGATGFFQKLDWFYRCLRGGINRKDFQGNDVFYFKSLLFLFFKNQPTPVQWEKKTIKEQFYLNDWTKTYRDKPTKMFLGLTTQQTKRSTSDALKFSAPDKKLIKDLLGLSSEEMWLSYEGDKITKTHQKRRLPNGEEKEIARFASPIIFKPIEVVPGTMTVFIYFDQSGLTEMLGETFDIGSKVKRKNIFPALKTPTSFSLDDFFKSLLSPFFDISRHVESRFYGTDEFKHLKAIFQSLSQLKPLNP